MSSTETSRPHRHGHMGVVAAAGLIAGAVLLVYVPSLPAVSRTILFVAGFHLIGALVLLVSGYAMAGAGVRRRLSAVFGRARPDRPDFGWSPGWTVGPFIGAAVAASAAVAIQLARPELWPLAQLLTLGCALFFAGGLFTRATMRLDLAVMPMVDLGLERGAQVLDAGCGAGRTTLALGKAYPDIRITAFDRFDAGYIEGGGQALLQKNLQLMEMEQRVHIRQGDLTALPWVAAEFDAAVSTNAMDHLGRGKEAGLKEILRVLKPGGRFLMVVWVPGWTMFAVANLLSLFLSPKRFWRKTAARCGFQTVDEGMFNGVWYLLLEKPR